MGVGYSQYLVPRDRTFRPEPDQVVALIAAWLDRGFIVLPDEIAPPGAPLSDARRERGLRFRTGLLPGDPLPPEPAPEPPQGFWARLVGIERLPPPPPDEWLPFRLPPTGLALAALARPATLIRWQGNPRATYPMLTMSEALAKGDDRFPPDLIIDLADDFINPDPDPYGIGGDEVRRMNPTCRCGFDLGYEAGMEHWLAGEKIRRVCPQCGLAFRPEDHVADFIEGSDGSKTPQPGGLCSRFAIIIDCNKDWPLYTVSNGELVDSLAQVSPLFMETCRSALGTELEDFSYYS